MSGPRPDVTVVVPTFRRADRLPALLDALAAQTMEPSRFEVVVVDDCSPDDTMEVARRLAGGRPGWRVLGTDRNGGPARARNTGWRSATAPIVAFIDDDCLPDPGWLEAGYEAITADTALGVVQGHTALPAGVDTTSLPDWSLWREITGPGPHFEGCNIFYRRAALEEGRGFDEDIRWWGEDTALGWRVLEAGWSRGFAEMALAVHAVERRGWWWHVEQGFNERNVVRLAAAHPGFRREAFWRSWAYRREDAALAAGLAGALAARWFRPAALAAVPYLWWRRPSVRRAGFFRLCLQVPTVDLARLAGQIAGALRHRVAIL